MWKSKNTMARNSEIADNSINRIVEGTKFEGSIQCESNIRIDGQFIGDLSTQGRLVIGSNGSLEGNIQCGDCEIEGNVKGKLHAKEKVVLKSTAKVEGEVYYGQLAIDSGAELSGTCYINTKVKDIAGRNEEKSNLEEKTA